MGFGHLGRLRFNRRAHDVQTLEKCSFYKSVILVSTTVYRILEKEIHHVHFI